MKNISVVTGGSSGLGLCLAKQLVKREENVVIIGRNCNQLASAVEQIKKVGRADVISYCGDISDERFVKEFYVSISKDYCIKHLFNCAGEGRFGKPEENSIDKVTRAFSGSLIGLILMSSNVLTYMNERGGTIINIMSTAALKGNALETVYCAAKWGARGFTEALKTYTKGSNISVIAVYPGGMNTSFWSEECGLTPEVSKFMNPEEVAEEIVNSVVDRKTMYVSEMTIDRK